MKKSGGAEQAAPELLAECCRAARALLNTQEGLQALLEQGDRLQTGKVPSLPPFHPSPPQGMAAQEVMEALLVSLFYVNVKTVTLCLVTLAALALVSPACHRTLVRGLAFKERLALLKGMVKSKEPELACAALLLINALVNQIEATPSRQGVRDLFLKHLNLRAQLKRLRGAAFLGHEELETQVLVFEESLEADLRGDHLLLQSAAAPRLGLELAGEGTPSEPTPLEPTSQPDPEPDQDLDVASCDPQLPPLLGPPHPPQKGGCVPPPLVAASGPQAGARGAEAQGQGAHG